MGRQTHGETKWKEVRILGNGGHSKVREASVLEERERVSSKERGDWQAKQSEDFDFLIHNSISINA